MITINPYIAFNGNAEEAFNFYKSVFGGEFAKVVRFKDLPGDPNHPMDESEADKILHIVLPIGSGNFLMANDVPASMGVVSESENRSKILVSVESKEEADRIFKGLSEGGVVEMPIGEAPWGAYFGMFRDKYGVEWMVDFDSRGKK